MNVRIDFPWSNRTLVESTRQLEMKKEAFSSGLMSVREHALEEVASVKQEANEKTQMAEAGKEEAELRARDVESGADSAQRTLAQDLDAVRLLLRTKMEELDAEKSSHTQSVATYEDQVSSNRGMIATLQTELTSKTKAVLELEQNFETARSSLKSLEQKAAVQQDESEGRIDAVQRQYKGILLECQAKLNDATSQLNISKELALSEGETLKSMKAVEQQHSQRLQVESDKVKELQVQLDHQIDDTAQCESRVRAAESKLADIVEVNLQRSQMANSIESVLAVKQVEFNEQKAMVNDGLAAIQRLNDLNVQEGEKCLELQRSTSILQNQNAEKGNLRFKRRLTTAFARLIDKVIRSLNDVVSGLKQGASKVSHSSFLVNFHE